MGVAVERFAAAYGRFDGLHDLKIDLEEETLVVAVQSPDCKPRALWTLKMIALMSWGEVLPSLSYPEWTDDASHGLEPC